MKRFLKFLIVGYVLLNVVIVGVGLVLKRMIRVEDDPREDDLSLSAIFGGVDFVSEASSLKYARVFAYAGGVEADFSGATFAENGVDVEATTIMGGIDIVVPRGCRVTLEARTLMGGTAGPRQEEELPDDAPELRVRCTTLMGGLNVRYAEDDGGGIEIEESPELEPESAPAPKLEPVVT